MEKIPIVKRLVNNIPPNPEELFKNLTTATLEKLIANELLLNFMADKIAQKIHAIIITAIKHIKVRGKGGDCNYGLQPPNGR